MVQGILSNIRICLRLPLPVPGETLQLAGVGSTEWQNIVGKKYTVGWIRVIKILYMGSLNSSIRSREWELLGGGSDGYI